MKKLFIKYNVINNDIKECASDIEQMLKWPNKTQKDLADIEAEKRKLERLIADKLELLDKIEDAAGVEIRELRKSINEIEFVHSMVTNKISA